MLNFCALGACDRVLVTLGSSSRSRVQTNLYLVKQACYIISALSSEQWNTHIDLNIVKHIGPTYIHTTVKYSTQRAFIQAAIPVQIQCVYFKHSMIPTLVSSPTLNFLFLLGNSSLVHGHTIHCPNACKMISFQSKTNLKT